MEDEFKRFELEDQWEKHFLSLVEKARPHSFEVGETTSNKFFNRYQDVKTYDRTRVRLSRASDTDYINANLVTVPKAARQYILTQGPLPETLGHFWLMVWEQKSNVIVMLNRIIEDLEESNKCEQYWPNSVGGTLLYKDIKLSVTLKNVNETKHFTVRDISLHDEVTDKSRSILQFHYTAWPDHGQPESPMSLLRLLSAIRKSGGLDKMDEPTIVHCSAGIGRSGTFCLIDSILTMVENQGSTEGIDIFNTLIDMRDYRMGLIQSPTQLRFAYMSIIYGIKILEKANKLHPHISSIKDSVTLDNLSQQQRINGSAQNNGKKPRRNKKKQSSSTNNSSSLNIFKKHLLIEALDATDSDSADSLFNDAMKQCPNIKKARNSSPEDLNDDNVKLADLIHNGASNRQADDVEQSVATKAQLLDNAINSLLSENTISTNSASSVSPLLSNASLPQIDSVLLRRRERELRNQKLAEKTNDIRNRMKAEELRRERFACRMAFLKKSAVYGGVAALVLSSIVYVYLSGHSSN